MGELQRIVTIIPAKPNTELEAIMRKLQVAAYCWVSAEEQIDANKSGRISK